MKRIAMMLAVLLGATSQSHALQPADCPSTGDACVIPAGHDFLDFDYPFAGIFGDTIVLGRVDLIWGPTLAACVNGQLQFSRDANAYTRPALTRKSVVCSGNGADQIKVLAAGESQVCWLYGLPLAMTAFQYGGFELAIYGQGGNDQITGGDGSDQLCGGTGNDRLFGRNQINELNGGPGNDDLFGGSDIDYLYGADGDDIVSDAAGNGGFRGACSAGGQNVPGSRIEGGNGTDCLQLPPYEVGWCYQQQEACNGTTVPCHGGITCGAGYDRLDTPAQGADTCEVSTNGLACRR